MRLMGVVQLFLTIQGKLKDSVVLGSRVMCSIGWSGFQIGSLSTPHPDIQQQTPF